MNDVLPTMDEIEDKKLETIQEYEGTQDQPTGDMIFNVEKKEEEEETKATKNEKKKTNPPVRSSEISSGTFYSLVPPLLKFFDNMNGVDFFAEVRRVKYNLEELSYKYHKPSMMLTFIDFFSISDIVKLRMLNTRTYHQNPKMFSMFSKKNLFEIFRYLQRVGNLESWNYNNKYKLRQSCWFNSIEKQTKDLDDVVYRDMIKDIKP